MYIRVYIYILHIGITHNSRYVCTYSEGNDILWSVVAFYVCTWGPSCLCGIYGGIPLEPLGIEKLVGCMKGTYYEASQGSSPFVTHQSPLEAPGRIHSLPSCTTTA